MESPEHLDPLARVANLANLARVANLANLARVANVASRVCLDPLALPARKARRVNLVRTDWTGVIMTILELSAV
jgi:hypothetical protein